jgi:hypothetical protein
MVIDDHSRVAYAEIHSSTGGKPPVTRLTNLPGHHT